LERALLGYVDEVEAAFDRRALLRLPILFRDPEPLQFPGRKPTNAIFGFTKTLRLMIKHLQPELGAVFWDERFAGETDDLAAGLQGNAEGNAAADDPASSITSRTSSPRCSASKTSRCRTPRPTI